MSSFVRHFARRYVGGLGWSVIPIGEGSKTPAIPSWTQFQQRLPTSEEIERWPWDNLAVVTGRVSGVCVIDEDDLDALSKDDRAKADAFLNLLPPTATSFTGKGKHRYFTLPHNTPSLPPNEPQAPPNGGSSILDTSENQSDGTEARFSSFAVVPTRVRFLPGLDARGEGGYALAPPSIHPSGRVYVWDDERNPEDGLAELPDWAADIIRGGQQGSEEPLWKKAVEGVGEGSRNASAASFIGHLLARSSPETHEYLWPAAQAWNKRNTPPLPDKELRSVFNSISKRDAREERPVLPSPIENEEDYKIRSARELLSRPFTPIPHTIGDMLPVGFATLAGKMKSGKSRLAMQFALSVALGGKPFNPMLMNAFGLGGEVFRGDVLYLALEDSSQRFRERLNSMLGGRQRGRGRRRGSCTRATSLERRVDRGQFRSSRGFLREVDSVPV
jgi:hypothetical protein